MKKSLYVVTVRRPAANGQVYSPRHVWIHAWDADDAKKQAMGQFLGQYEVIAVCLLGTSVEDL